MTLQEFYKCVPFEILTLFSYLLTPRSRVLLEKLTSFQLVKKFPAFYGTRRFITALTSAHHLSLSWASSIQSMSPTSDLLKNHLIIILPSTPGSPKWSLSLRFPHQNPVQASPLPHTRYMPRPCHSSRFYNPNKLGEDYRSLSPLLRSCLHSPVTSSITQIRPATRQWKMKVKVRLSLIALYRHAGGMEV